MQVLVKTRQLHLLTDWTRNVMKMHRLTQKQLAELIGITRSALSSKFVTGMTYTDVEKIAEALSIPKPDLAKATLLTLQQEIRDLSSSQEAAYYGMPLAPQTSTFKPDPTIQPFPTNPTELANG